METKYIVNNATGQTITGNITINGDLTVTGTSNNNIARYKALLTQTESWIGNNLSDFNYGLIVGETYTITDYVVGDDFSNIANVTSGAINETGCVFIATGDTPSSWGNGSQLTSSGNLVVDVIENNLGYPINWEVVVGPGIYFGYLDIIGSDYNTFPRRNTSVITQQNVYGPPIPYDYLKYYAGVGSFNDKDNVIVLTAWDVDSGSSVSGSLYYTPIEVNVKLDTDTTTVVFSGVVDVSYPFNYASVELLCEGNTVTNYIGDNTVVNNISELITELNTNEETSFLGTYSDDGDGNVLLTTTMTIVNRFCNNGNLTFRIFND